MDLTVRKKMYIDGKWVESVSGETRKVLYPYNRKVIAEVTEGNDDDVNLAVKAARKTFDAGIWSDMPACERGRLVTKLGDLIEENSEELAKLESLDTAKTMEESRWDMADIAGIFRYFGGLADKDGGEVINSPNPNTTSIIVREPIGVCSLISPWNYPLLQAAWKLAPALAAGCTVIMKPSGETPLTAIRVTELTIEAGIPAGVVNTVLGAGNTVGAAMSSHPDVDLVSFTGGIEAGKKIMKAASENFKKIAFELGGKNPNIIFSDADFESAVDYALNGVFFHAGQICSAGSRILVEESIHDKFVDALKKRAAAIVLGDAFDDKTEMGPLISEEHRQKVEYYVEVAKKEGAKLILGGKRPDAPELQDGFFYMPTIFIDCKNEMRVVQEEVFGPVITIEKFKTEEEVIEYANSTVYGLSGGVWTKDQDRANRVASALRMGTVWINDFNVYFVQAPWGGYKQSGIGRELGKIGLEEYTEVKHIYQNHNISPIDWFGKQ